MSQHSRSPDPVIEDVEYTDDPQAEEAGAAKLWSVYVNEAERYDKSLVESWKSDMEGMLIFAGLFSASLTAFIIESYKTLRPDPGDASLAMLERISRQLANDTNVVEEPAPFTPPTSALVCNSLWFISLGLSLACALVATLLEQWAREFIHRADARSAPTIRARMYSFLYYGMRRFKMHAVVDIIPSLLHASLLFFFVGLVAFLLPVSKLIAGLVAGILALVSGLYLGLTVLPLICVDAPYRTPLSNAVWTSARWIGLHLSALGTQRPAWRPPTWTQTHENWRSRLYQLFRIPSLADRVVDAAVSVSPEQTARDLRALKWHYHSLSDDRELETLVDAIPDAVWGPTKRNRRGTAYLRDLRDSSFPPPILAIGKLLGDSISGRLASEEATRRKIACYKAIWAIASIPEPPEDPSLPSQIHYYLWWLHVSDPAVPYQLSAVAVLNWSMAGWAKRYLDDTSLNDHYKLAVVKPYLEMLDDYIGFSSGVENLEVDVRDPAAFQQGAATIPRTLQHSIFFHHLEQTILHGGFPYRWKETLAIITPRDFGTFVAIDDLTEIESLLENIGSRIHVADAYGDLRVLEEIADLLSELWRPEKPRCIPRGLMQHLRRKSKDRMPTVHLLFGRSSLGRHLWLCLSTTLRAVSSIPLGVDDVLNIIMLIARWGKLIIRRYSRSRSVPLI